MKDRISIIIANYNYGCFLNEAIESACAQCYPNIEVILIDDGSTDNSLALAKKHNIIVLKQNNQGVCTARNNAAVFASGKYLLFLDADDKLFPDAISQLHTLLTRSGENTGYAYGQMEYFGVKTGLFLSRPFDATALAKANYICVTSLIKKEIFEKIGGFDRGFQHREDWEFYLRMLKHGYIGTFLESPILHYRKHKQPTRKKSKRPKRIAAARLQFLYPDFFRSQIIRHPIRYLYYRWILSAARNIKKYGPSADAPKRLG